MARKKPNKWQEEYDLAATALAGEPGELVWATDQYVAFRYIEPSVRIVFYPHKTTRGHYHIRVRQESCGDRERAVALMQRLDRSVPGWCTFTRKNT